MSVLYLFLLIIIIVFLICAIVGIVQFCIDLHRCCDLRDDFKDAITRVKQCNIDIFEDLEKSKDGEDDV